MIKRIKKAASAVWSAVKRVLGAADRFVTVHEVKVVAVMSLVILSVLGVPALHLFILSLIWINLWHDHKPVIQVISK